jgi:hypothetical protein
MTTQIDSVLFDMKEVVSAQSKRTERRFASQWPLLIADTGHAVCAAVVRLNSVGRCRQPRRNHQNLGSGSKEA